MNVGILWNKSLIYADFDSLMREELAGSFEVIKVEKITKEVNIWSAAESFATEEKRCTALGWLL